MSQITIEDANVSMEELLKNSPPFSAPKCGDLVEGRLIARSKNHILVDIGGVATGIIAGKELSDSTGTSRDLHIGDIVTAFVLEDENEEGMVVLSFRKAAHLKIWDKLRDIYEKSGTVEVIVKEANKGGLMTEIDGVRAFLPVSQLSPINFPRVDGANAEVILRKLEKLVGKKFLTKIILFDEVLPKIMVSEREAYSEVRGSEMKKLKIGSVIDGEVNGIVKFGIFLTFGNLEGLVHVSEIIWNENAKNPQREFEMSEKVKAKIIGFDDEKISLSIKRLTKDPWMEKTEGIKKSSVADGVINKVTDYGIFVTIAEEVTGLVHVTEFSDNSKPPAESFKEGEKVKVKILEINENDRSLKLSLKLDDQKKVDKDNKEEKKENSEKKKEKKDPEKEKKEEEKKDS